ncbi:hypothetical protein CPB84DRAFT_1770424 [Gymnopilus junonius]|uniref:Uncharacterized protein n=1 Tax=Gymnopilus junonius TaxID=109634 RepID=A0A9P5NV32_GYMJU|nr:hypothetical protein CPB84DRAFT_1770424 [Gymnopilus junonius]
MRKWIPNFAGISSHSLRFHSFQPQSTRHRRHRYRYTYSITCVPIYFTILKTVFTTCIYGPFVLLSQSTVHKLIRLLLRRSLPEWQPHRVLSGKQQSVSPLCWETILVSGVEDAGLDLGAPADPVSPLHQGTHLLVVIMISSLSFHEHDHTFSKHSQQEQL